MTKKLCENCGYPKEYKHSAPIDDELNRTWGLSSKLRKRFNLREGAVCKHCGANKRAQGLAQAILDSKFGCGATSLREWVDKANQKGLKVCELNSCHELHSTLKGLTHLTYAEYGTATQQDIEQLTYDDNEFDLVLHSETLEHVSQPDVAMDECRRVINDSGLVIFTTPVLWSRRTRRRATKKNGLIKKLLPASYHAQQTDDYLVFQEYGHDIDALLGCDVVYAEPESQSFVFSSEKRGAKIGIMKKISLVLPEMLLKG